MGYYMAPGRGDYYRGGRGDLGGFLRKAGGAVIRGGIGFLTGGPGGAVRGILGGAGGGTTSVSVTPPTIGGGRGIQLGPSVSVTRSSYPMSAHVDPSQLSNIFPHRRRMNPANPKALRRALRRVQGFGALAARASADVAKANRALNRIPRKTTKKRR